MKHSICVFGRGCARFLFGAVLMAQIAAAEPDVAPSDLPRIAPKSPEEALGTFAVAPGLRVDLVASEPLVVDPIAMCFDENGRLFVVEMRDYSERRDERLGRIRLLEDTDGDGRMDRSTIFAENLPWPSALIWYDGGLFVGSTPDIYYFKDGDGDGKADEKRIAFSGFGAAVQRLNVQQLFNSFTWGLDNRIHGASGGNGGIIRCPEHPERPPIDLRNSDFSFDPKTLEMRLENGGGQYGLTFDHAGRKFVCSNSAHIREVMYERDWVLPNMLHPLPSPALDIPTDGPAGPVYRTSPDEPWRVLRTKWRVAGLVPGPIESGKPSGFFTSATGLTIYRGNAIADLTGDAIVADVGSNLVHRKKLRPNGVPFLAERAPGEEHKEFLTSTDLWFRPVSFANGPDGALYLADMYRETIEHPWSLPANIKKYLDLNSGNDRGRIYRIVPEGFRQPAVSKLGGKSTEELVALLGDSNGWKRDTAARLLYERQDPSAKLALRKLLRTGPVQGQIRALGALEGLGALSVEDLEGALTSPEADARETALRMALEAGLEIPNPEKLANDPAPRVRYLLAWNLARAKGAERKEILNTMLSKATDSWEKQAIEAALSVDPEAKTSSVALRSEPALTHPASRQKIVEKYQSAVGLTGDATKGHPIYQERCSTCHRLAGEGHAVGPDLESVRTAGAATILGNILDPNREVALRFVTYEVTTDSGDEYSGILSHESANGLTLLQANGVEQFIPRATVRTFRATGRSLMPEALEEGLSPQDLANLISFITR